MKSSIALLSTCVLLNLSIAAQFSTNSITWTIPNLTNSWASQDMVNGTGYSVVDFNGDGRPDLVDAQDNETFAVWNDGITAHWKVYLNTGTSFSSTALIWAIPNLESNWAFEDQVNSTNYSLVDFDGDGLPDLVDAQDDVTNAVWNDGVTAHWKVYLNTGTAFSSSALIWTIPNLESNWIFEDQLGNANYSVVDFDGDGRPDLVDAQNDVTDVVWNDGITAHWKVYLNTGTSFSSTALIWEIPTLTSSFNSQDMVYATGYSVVDFDGDGKPDLVDAQDNAAFSVWNDGVTAHWKVYLNTGTSFSDTALIWTIPSLTSSFASQDMVNSTGYNVIDFNGDGNPDLVDAQDNNAFAAWNDGTTGYWKVYLNSGTSFSSSALIWTIPNLTSNWNSQDMVNSTGYSVIDFDGDGRPDVVDAQDNNAFSVWNDGTTAHWKVYLNDGATVVGLDEVEQTTHVIVYPNPAIDQLVFELDNSSNEIITIYNLNGSILETIQVSKPLTTVNVQGLAAGIYMYKVADEEGGFLETGRFIKYK